MRPIALLLAVALAVAACDMAALPPPSSTTNERWSPYLVSLVRGRTSEGLDRTPCDESGFPTAVLDALWARSGPHPDPTRKDEIDAWLGTVGFGFFEQCYAHGAQAIASMPARAPWHRAEADYSAWLSTQSDRMLERIYAAEACRAEDCVPFSRRWPGFDAFGAGLPLADRAEGPGHGADLGFFRQAMDDPAMTQRLVATLGERDDPALVRAVIASSTRSRPDRVVALWRALEPWPRLWREAAVAAADTVMEEHAMQIPLLQEARRAYATPEHREVALYVLGRDWTWSNERGGFFVQPWEKFPADYGGPIDMGLFARLLDVSPRAVDLVPIVWPALAKGTSRVQPVLDHLDAYLDGSVASGRTLRKIAGTVCQRGDARELKQLHEWLLRRAKPGSAHEDDVGFAALSTMPGHCIALM
jgi:hypothetical protein